MGESSVGWWIGGAVFVLGLVLFVVGLATTEDGVTNTLALVGAFVAGGGAVLACLIDRWVNDGDSDAVPREAPTWLEPQPLKKKNAGVPSLIKAKTPPE